MNKRILEIDLTTWRANEPSDEAVRALEAGKVLYFPRLHFDSTPNEQLFFTSEIRDPKSRNISLDAFGKLKGARGDDSVQSELASMMGRFREQASTLIYSLLPQYLGKLRLAPTSYRPSQVETRTQSWRADDKRLHVDAFPSRPNYGERILRVFTNVNPIGEPRIWRVGEPFEVVAQRYLPRIKPYVLWQAKLLNTLHITKSLRSEYDHIMLKLHDAMKSDLAYQRDAEQITIPFPSGSVWVCFSDQVSHAAMSGQYMMEQTFHLPAEQQYDPSTSPLAILSRLTERNLL